MWTSYIIASFAIVSFVAAGPAAFFQKCDDGDSKCIKEQIEAAIPTFALGIPELGIKPLDPYFFKKIDASSSTLKLVLHDITVKGLKNCKSQKIHRDVSGSTLTVNLQCDVVADGDYEMTGSILIIPMEGKGKVHIELNKIMVGAELNLADKTGEDGKTHWSIKKWKNNFELKETKLRFDNLFPENEVLGRAARAVMRDSPNELMKELGPPVIKKMTEKIIEHVHTLFKKMPKEDLIN